MAKSARMTDRQQPEGGAAPKLTPRQEEVARLTLAGLTNDEVAARLHISPRTARAHTDALEERLGVTRRRHIAAAYRALLGRVQL